MILCWLWQLIIFWTTSGTHTHMHLYHTYVHHCTSKVLPFFHWCQPHKDNMLLLVKSWCTSRNSKNCEISHRFCLVLKFPFLKVCISSIVVARQGQLLCVYHLTILSTSFQYTDEPLLAPQRWHNELQMEIKESYVKQLWINSLTITKLKTLIKATVWHRVLTGKCQEI